MGVGCAAEGATTVTSSTSDVAAGRLAGATSRESRNGRVASHSIRVSSALWARLKADAALQGVTLQAWMERVLRAAVNGTARRVASEGSAPAVEVAPRTPAIPNAPNVDPPSAPVRSDPPRGASASKVPLPLTEWDELCVCGHAKRAHLSKKGEVGRCEWGRGCRSLCRAFTPVGSVATRAATF
jgi:hypothetical protein